MDKRGDTKAAVIDASRVLFEPFLQVSLVDLVPPMAERRSKKKEELRRHSSSQ